MWRLGACALSDERNRIREYRTIWISDTHLGTPGARAKALLHFLKYTRSETLYLVGDIIDGWQLRKRFYWPQEHNDVIQKLLRKARHGTRVIYIPGNHDEAARHYLGFNFGEIAIKEDDIHETANGRKLWVVHGDLFDGVIQHARWLAYLGDRAYVLLLKLNGAVNRIRNLLNLPYWSLSQFLKHRVKSAVSFISAFETAMLTETRRRGCDGVVCGHIHKPEMREIDGLLYANDGDWVESLSALVEHHDGRLELLDWQNAERTGARQVRTRFPHAETTAPGAGAAL
ncbi:MAG: UDP-2,3-diacylglucosamine diphosphatase [Candidatus Puniceispirillaceae bacterium]